MLNTNLTSAMLVSREVAKRMIPRKAGKIVNICSLMSDVGRITTGPYTAAKGGLKMLTKAMCADWAQFNIQVNAVGPGYFITEMTQVLADNPAFDAWVKDRTPSRPRTKIPIKVSRLCRSHHPKERFSRVTEKPRLPVKHCWPPVFSSLPCAGAPR